LVYLHTKFRPIAMIHYLQLSKEKQRSFHVTVSFLFYNLKNTLTSTYVFLKGEEFLFNDTVSYAG